MKTLQRHLVPSLGPYPKPQKVVNQATKCGDRFQRVARVWTLFVGGLPNRGTFRSYLDYREWCIVTVGETVFLSMPCRERWIAAERVWEGTQWSLLEMSGVPS